MSIPDLSQSGKVAVVTGGRRGLGKTMVLAFAEAGIDVAVCDLLVDGGKLETTAREIREFG
ncbi:MAG TPA: SDR family NAD(P)-dependent oxidoreductase [Dehalococcoidales bacterium]|nr:SDR family NAD(P)-dependent oxidoreductase [Dehalococcoidales bacterium]